MRIQATIDNLLNAFARRRREGHTTALFTGAANTPNITIIAADQRHAHDLDDHHHGPTYITLAQLDKLTGTRGPIAIDHHALQTVLAAANHEIDRSTKRNSQLTNQLEEVRNEAYNANLRAERAKRERDAAATDKDRLRYALDQIGFYFAGTENQHIADICLRVLNGESMQDIRRENAHHAHQDAPQATATTEEAPKALRCIECRQPMTRDNTAPDHLERWTCTCGQTATRHKRPGEA